LSIANYLTLFRLVLSPIFILVYSQAEFFGITAQVLPFILLSLLFISELTDACDGYFARKYNQVTDLGKILDPMADSISRITVFLAFTQPPVNLPILLVFVFLYRDSVVSTLRTICALKGFALAARTSGKIKAVIQAVSAFIILLLMITQSQDYISLDVLQQTSAWVVGIAALYTLCSGVEYIYANRKYIAKLLVVPKAKALAAKSKAYFVERKNKKIRQSHGFE
jgi:CDP-diacylglycerol--glycerol-3-phosphate 3-phosphatidyltransferase